MATLARVCCSCNGAGAEGALLEREAPASGEPVCMVLLERETRASGERVRVGTARAGEGKLLVPWDLRLLCEASAAGSTERLPSRTNGDPVMGCPLLCPRGGVATTGGRDDDIL